jgi:putative hydrolase of the HAD superfamily
LAKITAIFWDIGGVLLTNGWDTATRHAAAAKFGLEVGELDARHAKAFPIFERGEISLDDYLTQSVFYRPRPFTGDEFKNFIYSCSSELSESRALADHLAASDRFLMAAINNEGRELNEFRIKKFDLRRTISLFFSSCYVGLRKPDGAIYRLALDVTQRTGAETIFIDDRPENTDGARSAGMNAVRFENASQLRSDLQNFGIQIAS